MEDLQEKNASGHQNREILKHPSKMISSKMPPVQLIIEFSLTFFQYQDQRFLLILSSSEGEKEKRKNQPNNLQQVKWFFGAFDGHCCAGLGGSFKKSLQIFIHILKWIYCSHIDFSLGFAFCTLLSNQVLLGKCLHKTNFKIACRDRNFCLFMPDMLVGFSNEQAETISCDLSDPSQPKHIPWLTKIRHPQLFVIKTQSCFFNYKAIHQ